MAALYDALPLSAQTAYAQLFDAALGAQHVQSIADLSGSFNAKTVKGRRYWYFQYSEPSGNLRQIYVGPEGEPVRRLMDRKAEPAASQALVPMARSALALGCVGILPRHYRVVRRLADYGFFRAGGTIIGTHAFLASGNMLGARWTDVERTQDIDFAHAGKSVSLLLPADLEVRTDDAISSLDMGFLPISGLGGKTGGTYLIPKEPEFRLDFLTPMHRKSDAPYLHPQLHVVLQPLPFMEYSLEHTTQAVMFCPEGAVVVNVPDPARFALHELIVHGERSKAFASKSGKELAQAAHLLAFLLDHRPDSVADAATDLTSRGPGWRSRLRRGALALRRAYPALSLDGLLEDGD